MGRHGRFSDLLLHTARVVVAAAVFNYAADLQGLESRRTAQASFGALATLNEWIGRRMKEHRVWGSTDFVVAFSTFTCRRILVAASAAEFLHRGSVSPTDAGSRVGKAKFFESTTLGRLGMLVNTRHMGKRGSRPLWSHHRLRSNIWQLQLYPGPFRRQQVSF